MDQEKIVYEGITYNLVPNSEEEYDQDLSIEQDDVTETTAH